MSANGNAGSGAGIGLGASGGIGIGISSGAGVGGGDSASANASTALASISAGSLLTAADAAGASLSVPVPFQSKIVLVERTRVAGTTHVKGIDQIVERLQVGMDLRLQREPDNLADRWAIKVFAGDQKIGFVPADCNEMLARLMDGGKAVSAKLTDKEKLGNWNKLHMEVSLDD